MVKIIEFGAKRSASLAVLVFGASVVATLVFWALLPARFRLAAADQSDYYSFYEPVARNIIAGRGISLADQSPATLFPPGCPLVLAGLFVIAEKVSIPETVVVSGFSILAMGLISSLVFLMSRAVFPAMASLVSAGIWMTYPFALWLTRQPNSEVPFMLFLYAGLALFCYLVVRRPYSWALFVLCGYVFGIAMLIRPIAIGIVLVLSLIVWILRRELRRRFRALLITMLLLGNLLALIPWEAWVFSKTGRVIPISTSGEGNVGEGLIFAVDKKRYHAQIVSEDIVSVMNEIQQRFNQGGTSGEGIGRIVVTEFRARPVAMAKLIALKVARSWYGTDSGRQETTILLVQLAYLAIILWAARKIWRQGGIYRKFAIGGFLIVIYFWGMTVLAISMARYMVPVMGPLFVLIGGALFSGPRLNVSSEKIV